MPVNSATYDTFTDQQIVAELLQRNAEVTRWFFYKKCYPLFCAVQRQYTAAAASSLELIAEMYLLLLTPVGESGRCPLERFAFNCSLAMWLKIIAVNHCRRLSKREDVYTPIEKTDDDGDRFLIVDDSIAQEAPDMNSHDVGILLAEMSNERYREIIRLRYVEHLSNEQTAERLGMTMDNFYNKHRLAKAQFSNILRKEGLIK